jgi:hypothetical protein
MPGPEASGGAKSNQTMISFLPASKSLFRDRLTLWKNRRTGQTCAGGIIAGKHGRCTIPGSILSPQMQLPDQVTLCSFCFFLFLR